MEEEAIRQLEDLGVTRVQAKKALARYNNDVARAADFIFSGNFISDDEEEQNEQDSEALAISLSLQEEEESKRQLEKTKSTVSSDYSNLSVVPYKEPQWTPQTVPSNIKQINNHSSVTWWSDPSSPLDRAAKDDVPIGLRPPSYNFSYAPVILQALFHISAFQHAVLSFRPIPSSWGSTSNYWKGQGEPMPGYVTIKKVVQQSSEDLTKDELGYNDINEGAVQEGILEEDEDEEEKGWVEAEVKSLPKCLQVLGEMQKLFAFLGNTKRQYGNVSDYTKALNTRSNWEEDEIQFESFLDMIIGNLADCDQYVDPSTDASHKPSFKSLFLMKAKTECGQDYDEDDQVPEKGSSSFYECLDPLVYESYANEPREEDEPLYKFTSFISTPPILFIVLENRSKSNYDYRIDTTIYLDRYMHHNKEWALEEFRKVHNYHADIRQSQKEIDKLEGSVHSISKRDLLHHAIDYFKEKKAIDQDVETIQYVLENIKQKMTEKAERLESLLNEKKKQVYSIFNREDMKKCPYHLRATFHHDGKSGHGHHWAYIWVETKEKNLLEDIPNEGSWYKFCDALVTPATEQDILDDPFPPFAFAYMDASIPTFSKDQLSDCTPSELKEFIKLDNTEFEHEIASYNNSNNVSYPIEDDSWFTEKTEEYQIEQVAPDDLNSVGTAVGQLNTDESNSIQTFTGQGFSKLKALTNQRIVEVSAYPCDDFRLLANFETFLARTQHHLNLEHLYLLYSNQNDDFNKDDVNVEASKTDEDLKFAWKHYELYLSIGQLVVKALHLFINRDYQAALQIWMHIMPIQE
ncbi:cysteine proteinase [Rhizopus microsporus ATCC 52813]|uniref:Cysteine proteinase n=1 Tax=Rhizopus microsporus ATCC 52813 TaxID=1340429 RepID=A0A2G4SS02_RHIZD|nr:cysteine proteinase [Rhizopus microsporus ATCC 52813]PHZ11166.1 cysteine proteinase [Rhizopus microsporus ATCC 52813]